LIRESFPVAALRNKKNSKIWNGQWFPRQPSR
jgi:hypothetical protein